MTTEKVRFFSPVNTALIIINVLAFIVLEILGDTTDAYFMLEHGAIYSPLVVEDGEYYRLFTAMFMHFGMDHLSSNVMALIFLGDNLERALGKVKYVILYIVSGLCAGACSVAFNMIVEDNVVSAGASGAIFGVIGALLYAVWRNKGRMEDLTGVRFTLMVIYMLFSGFTSSGVDNVAHVGGFVSGFLLSVILYRKKRRIKESFS